MPEHKIRPKTFADDLGLFGALLRLSGQNFADRQSASTYLNGANCRASVFYRPTAEVQRAPFVTQFQQSLLDHLHNLLEQYALINRGLDGAMTLSAARAVYQTLGDIDRTGHVPCFIFGLQMLHERAPELLQPDTYRHVLDETRQHNRLAAR